MIFNSSGIIELLITLIVIIISLSFHESGHGIMAYFMGDRTAKLSGRITLNPLKHFDVLGFIMMLVAGFGWAKAVPVNMYNFKDPKKGMAITALAGPLANILLAFISCIVFYLLVNNGIYNDYVLYFLQVLFSANCSLAMFNLLPISPLDGSKILFAFLPQKYYYKMMYLERYGFIILIIFINLPIFNRILSNGVYNLQNAIIRVVELLPL